jgi:methionine-rich copper-binding protein CopC
MTGSLRIAMVLIMLMLLTKRRSAKAAVTLQYPLDSSHQTEVRAQLMPTTCLG